MLMPILLAVAAVLLLAGALWSGLAYAMRRPALARRLMRVRPARYLFARLAAAGVRSARRRAEREGTLPATRPVSDLEIALAASGTEEARQARAMLARMSPRQRNEISRRTLGADGLSGLLADAAALDGAEMPGRAGRRRVAGAPGSAGRDSARDVQRRRAVAKRRAARKRARR